MEEYLNKILHIETESKYLRIYVNLMKASHARNMCILEGKSISKGWMREQLKKELGYVELHHIYPKWFRDVKSYKDLENMIYLTAREHFVAHKCLYYALKSKCSFWGLYMMCSMKTRKQKRLTLNSREFEKMRRLHAAFVKTQTRYNGSKHPGWGKPLSDETRKKISKTLTGRTLSSETKAKLKANHPKLSGDKHYMWNKKHTDSYKAKMSEVCKSVEKTPEWNKKNSEANKGRMMIMNVVTGKKRRVPIADAINMINDGTNNWVKSSSSEGLILIANTVTKERARPKRDVGLALIESSNGVWIRLAQNKTIPDYVSTESSSSTMTSS